MNWADFFNNLEDYNEAFMNSGNLKKPEPEEAPPSDLVIRVPANILSGNCSLATFSAYIGSLSEEDCKNLHLLDYMQLMKFFKEMNLYAPAQIDAFKTEPLAEDHK